MDLLMSDRGGTTLFLQVNDAAVSLGLVRFGCKAQLFYTQITEYVDWKGRGERRSVAPLTCCVG